MSADRLLEQRITSVMTDAAPTREPDGLLTSVLTSTGRMRPRPRWLASIKEPPMRISSRVAVGSPTARLAYALMLSLLLAILATAAVVGGASLLPSSAIIVAQDGSGTVTTITEALIVAQDGDTIVVKPGTYPESLTVSKDVTITGDGVRDQVIVEYGESSPTHQVWYGTVPYALVIDAARATVSDLTVRWSSPVGANPANVAIVVEDGGSTLQNLTVIPPTVREGVDEDTGASVVAARADVVIEDSTLGGWVMITEASTGTIDRTAVARGIVFSEEATGTVRQSRAPGITLEWGSSPLLEDNDVGGPPGSLPDFAADYAEGIDLLGSSTALIRNNKIHGSRVGISISVSAEPTVESNEVTGNATGIALSGSDAVLRDNRIHENVTGILIGTGSSPTLEGNRVERNTTGITIGRNASAVMEGNLICDNDTDLQVADGADPLSLEGNEICGNSTASSTATP